MSLPALPVEIYELIIEAIATWERTERRIALSTCSLVCASWHSFALRHIFHSISLPHDFTAGGPSHILHLIESNMEISRCVKSISIDSLLSRIIENSNDADFQQFCRLISTSVADLSFYQAALDLASRPLIRSGIFHLLKSPNLRQLLFVSNLQTSFLEPVSRHLENLILSNIIEVVLDHQDSSKLVKSDLLQFIILGWPPGMDIIHQTPDLCPLFERAQHVQLLIDPGNTAAIHWNRKLDWGNCTSLDLAFGFLPALDQPFLSCWQGLPWESLSVLKKLKVGLVFSGKARLARAQAGDNPDTSPSWVTPSPNFYPIFLSSVSSRLKSLESLHLRYQLFTTFKTSTSVYQALRQLVHDCLDPTFQSVDRFRSLGHLGICIDLPGAVEVFEAGMTEEVLRGYVSELLPSVFGPGGRREVDGWAVRVEAKCYSQVPPGFEEYL